MDQDERCVRHARAKAMSELLLDAEAYRAAVTEEKAATVVHRDDGYSCDWAATMPRRSPAPQPARTMTDTEIARMIADAMAEVDSRIAAAFQSREWQNKAILDAVGEALGKERERMRQELRAEIAKSSGESAHTELDGRLRSA